MVKGAEMNEGLEGLRQMQSKTKTKAILAIFKMSRQVTILIPLFVASILFNIFTLWIISDRQNISERVKGKHLFFRGLVRNYYSDQYPACAEAARDDARTLARLWRDRTNRVNVPWSSTKLTLEEMAIQNDGPFFCELRRALATR